MAAPIYVVSFDSQQLPGYVQVEDRPIAARWADDTMFGRDGFTTMSTGHEGRQISLTFWVTSRLSNTSTDLAHLEDCQDQWREAIAILSRLPGEKPLSVNDTDRYYMATFRRSTMPQVAGKSRSMTYTVDFLAQPWAIGTTAVTDTFSGNGTADFTMGNTRRTYPIFEVPATVETFTATDTHGKTLTFLRDTQPGIVVIDCGQMVAYRFSDESDAIGTMITPNFGLYYEPGYATSGSYSITITGYTGSGSVEVNMYPRYEL